MIGSLFLSFEKEIEILESLFKLNNELLAKHENVNLLLKKERVEKLPVENFQANIVETINLFLSKITSLLEEGKIVRRIYLEEQALISSELLLTGDNK